MKKKLALVLLIAMVMSMFTACGYDRPSDAKYTGSDMMKNETYKYSDSESYIRINGNMTYEILGDDAASEKILFWEVSEEDKDTIILYDENGEMSGSLTCVGTYDKFKVTDADGTKLERFKGTIDGTYYCCLDYFSVEDGKLSIVSQLPYWVSDKVLAELKEGSTLDMSVYDDDEIIIDKIEKKSDVKYVINDKYNLKFVERKGAWLLAPHEAIAASGGRCELSEEYVFEDKVDNGAHNALEACIEENDTVFANVTVENGMVVKIEVTALYGEPEKN